MRKVSYSITNCAVLAAFLIFGTPLYVDAAENEETPYTSERQALREESASIRNEHDALEAEREKLKTRCLDAKGQDKNECEKERDDLRARREALQARVKALVDKIHAERAHGHKGAGEHGEHRASHEGGAENSPTDDMDSPPISMEPLSK